MSQSKYKNPFSATFNGILDLFRKGTPIGVLKESDRLEGQNCLVTGSNTGLGFAVAQQLAERGANVYMACRSGIPMAGEKIKELTGNQNVTMMPIDLTDIRSVSNFVEDVKQKNLTFDIAIFNAAMVPSGSTKTESGFDQMFLVNYLSKFILVNALLDVKAFNTEQRIPRIIFTSSESHRTNEEIDFEKLGVFEEYSMGKVIELYGQYKLLLNTFSTELSKRINREKLNISVHALCPGPVNSDIARAAPSWVKPILKVVFGIFFSSPKDAAQPLIYLAASKEIEGRNNIYLHLMQEKSMDEKALNAKNGKRLWERSEKLIKSIKN